MVIMKRAEWEIARCKNQACSEVQIMASYFVEGEEKKDESTCVYKTLVFQILYVWDVWIWENASYYLPQFPINIFLCGDGI